LFNPFFSIFFSLTFLLAMAHNSITFEINAMALALATVLVRHQYNQDNIASQYSALDLANEVNGLPFNDIIRIHDIAILQQGIFEFKKILNKFYIQHATYLSGCVYF